MKTQAQPTSKFFPALTGIRAIAAYMVFFHHYNPLPEAWADGWLHGIAAEMYTGVGLFFVLSGFLIGYRYNRPDREFNWGRYFRNRVARIYPMYFLLTTLTFAVYAWKKGTDAGFDLPTYFLNITFLRGFFNELKFSGIPQGWSLTVEETFYFSAPLFFFLLRKRRFFYFLLPVLVMALGFALVGIFGSWAPGGFFENPFFMLNYTFFGRVFEFFIGLFLAQRYIQSGQDRAGIAYTLLGGLMSIAGLAALFALKGTAEYGLQSAVGQMLHHFLLPSPGFALLFYGLITERTWLARFLSSRVMRLLGKSSYIFYLVHLGVTLILARLISHHWLWYFVYANVLSILLYLYVEEPANRWLRAWPGKSKAP